MNAYVIYICSFIAGESFLKISKESYDFSFIGVNMKKYYRKRGKLLQTVAEFRPVNLVNKDYRE